MATRTLTQLDQQLRCLDGRGYKAYKEIAGRCAADNLILCIDHVQGDPFAEPSRLRGLVDTATAALPPWSYSTPQRAVSTADFLGRKLWALFDSADSRCGSGQSGVLQILQPGQQVLARTSLIVSSQGEVEARFRVGLPAEGRRIAGRAAADLICRNLIALLERALIFDPEEQSALQEHLCCVEDAQALRAQLDAHNLVAFVGDQAVLPRSSGIEDTPLASDQARAFQAPEPLKVTLNTPNAGPVTGLGIPRGITLIVGGGYHGKSTLLRALERGVYDHIPGDGRQRVVTIGEAVKVRAEDGRSVREVDISNFIGDLPDGQNTRRFSSDNASGSTSQAAAISEAIEVGARCLLLDEDTSATNFMIRDARMQQLVVAEQEPITPFIDRAEQLFEQSGVSVVLVIGGSGDYFDIAQTVIQMRDYQPQVVTEKAKQVAASMPTNRQPARSPWCSILPRVPKAESINPRHGRRDKSIKVFSARRAQFGSHSVELDAVDQLVHPAQTRAIAEALVWARGRLFDDSHTLADALDSLMQQLAEQDLDLIQDRLTGDLAAFRRFELAAFLNRLRTLAIARQRSNP